MENGARTQPCCTRARRNRPNACARHEEEIVETCAQLHARANRIVEMIEDVVPPHSEVVTSSMEDGAMTVALSAECAVCRCAVWREPDLKWRPALPTAATSGSGARQYNAATAGHSHDAAVRRRHYRLNDSGALYDGCVRRCAVSGATRRRCAATAGSRVGVTHIGALYPGRCPPLRRLVVARGRHAAGRRHDPAAEKDCSGSMPYGAAESS